MTTSLVTADCKSGQASLFPLSQEAKKKESQIMSAISITAPQFTDEEVLREEQTYTDEEIQQAYRDLYGGPQPEPPTVTEYILEEFYQILEEDFPPDDKEAYLEAVDRAPYLINSESDPQLFLKAEYGSVCTAVERFVNYWEIRRWLFGDRAWLPMTATGNGALSPLDVDLLESGFCTILPQQDKH